MAHVRQPVEKDHLAVDCIPNVTERTITTCICQECIIENYSARKDRTYYELTREVEGRERTLKLFKTKNIHAFQFHCEVTSLHLRKKSLNAALAFDKMVFHIVYDQNTAVWAGNLIETAYGYSIEVPNDVVQHADNKFLHQENRLVVQFSYRHYSFSRAALCRVGNSRNVDEEAVSNDFLSLYESGKLTDFVLFSGDGKEYNVHKCICKARSKVLDSITNDDFDHSGLSIETHPEILEVVIRYMYSGKLPDLSADDLLAVAAVADTLDIASLLFSLTVALREKLNTDNALKIRREAEKFNLHQLFAYTEDFLPPKEEVKKKGRRSM